MSVVLSPLGVGQQFFGGSSAFTGNTPLTAGLLYVYAAGTTTPATTYTSSSGTTANTNPIVLDANGRVPYEIWWTPGSSYKFVLTDALGNSVSNGTWDNVIGINDLLVSSSNAAAAISYLPPGTSAVATTVAAKLSQVSSIADFGTVDSTGSADCTAVIQLALNAGLAAIYVPAGKYKFSALTMPTTSGFVLYGEGTASVLVQTGTGISWPVNASLGYYEGYIRDLSFNGSAGTGNTIDTSYTGGTTLENIYITNVPVGFYGVRLNGSSGAGATYSHDHRVKNLQIYSNTAGQAGLCIGANNSDANIDGYIMNGNFVVNYGIYCEDGALSTTFENCHPYNCANNVLANANTGGTIGLGFTFSNCWLDNATNDLVSLTKWNGTIFDSCYFQATKASKNAVTLSNCSLTYFDTPRFDGATGASYCINETGTTDYTQVLGGMTTALGNWTSPVFNLIGSHSVVKNFAGVDTEGQQISFVGSTSATVAAGSTVYLGCNGAQASAAATDFMIPIPSGLNVQNCAIAWDTAPGAGTYTFTLIGNGATLVAASGSANPTAAITGSVFSVTINIAQGSGAFLAQFQMLGIKMVTSGAAGAPNVRYAINCIG